MKTEAGENVMAFIDGKSFRCDCGCNVFQYPVNEPAIYVCNSCGERWIGERSTPTPDGTGKE